MIFPADYDEIQLQKISNDVISVTSSPLRHRKRHQNNVRKKFALPIKIWGYSSGFSIFIVD